MLANEPVTRKVLDDWTRTVGEQFLRSVRPIYTAKRRGILDQVGSCVLMRLAGRRCVVTAAHISDFLDYSTLYIGGMKELVEITGDFLVTSRRKGSRRFDPCDFTVLPVSSATALALGDVSYIDARAIARNRQSKHGLFYLAFGYPSTRNKRFDVVRRDAAAKAFRHVSRAVDDAALSRLLGVSGDDHLFVSYEKQVLAGSGNRYTSTKGKGFSGGALIELDVASCRAGSPAGKLAGIITSRSLGKNPKLVATKIQVVRAAMRARGRKARAQVP